MSFAKVFIWFTSMVLITATVIIVIVVVSIPFFFFLSLVPFRLLFICGNNWFSFIEDLNNPFGDCFRFLRFLLFGITVAIATTPPPSFFQVL